MSYTYSTFSPPGPTFQKVVIHVTYNEVKSWWKILFCHRINQEQDFLVLQNKHETPCLFLFVFLEILPVVAHLFINVEQTVYIEGSGSNPHIQSHQSTEESRRPSFSLKFQFKINQSIKILTLF